MVSITETSTRRLHESSVPAELLPLATINFHYYQLMGGLVKAGLLSKIDPRLASGLTEHDERYRLSPAVKKDLIATQFPPPFEGGAWLGPQLILKEIERDYKTSGAARLEFFFRWVTNSETHEYHQLNIHPSWKTNPGQLTIRHMQLGKPNPDPIFEQPRITLGQRNIEYGLVSIEDQQLLSNIGTTLTSTFPPLRRVG